MSAELVEQVDIDQNVDQVESTSKHEHLDRLTIPIGQPVFYTHMQIFETLYPPTSDAEFTPHTPAIHVLLPTATFRLKMFDLTFSR